MHRIIYTELPTWPNIGDHAQVLGVKKWFHDYFPNYEITAFGCSAPIEHILKAIGKNDLIFVHSGGNLGDLYLNIDGPRRLLIKNCPENKIVILPKTIWFDKPEELRNSEEIYNARRDLTIISRDLDSHRFAKEHFSKCRNIACPDFALYLDPPKPRNGERHGTLLVLRKDIESVFSPSDKEKIRSLLTGDVTELDLHLSYTLPPSKRQEEFEKTLRVFQRHEVVVTDRLHGLIFSVMTKTPCVGLPHRFGKVKSGAKWFKGLKHVTVVEDISEIPKAIQLVASNTEYETVDWKGKFFEPLKAQIFSNSNPIPYCINSTCLSQLIKGRRSIRRWHTFPVEQREIDMILEAGAFAPSGANDQRVRFLVVKDSEKIKRICATKGDWCARSFPPVIILVLFDLGKKGTHNNEKLDKVWYRLMWQDTAASMQNMMLMAESLGLSTCWVSLAFEREIKAVRELMGLADRYKIACSLFLGYGKDARTTYASYEKLRWLGKPVKRNLSEFTLKEDREK